MKTWTIGKRIVLGFTIIIGITLTLGALSYWELAGIQTRTKALVEDALPGVFSISQVEGNARAQYRYLMLHVISTNAQDTARAEEEIKHSIEKTPRLSLTTKK